MTQSEGNRERQVELKVVIRQSAGNYNRYEWHEAEQALVLAERVWQAGHRQFEVATVPGTISRRGVELAVLIPVDQYGSDFPGAVVKVRPVGLVAVTRADEGEGEERLIHQHFLIAIALADPQYRGIKSMADLLPSWKAAVEDYLRLSPTEVKKEANAYIPFIKDTDEERQPPALKVSWQGLKEAREVIGEARLAFRLAEAANRGPGQTGPGWQVSEEELDDYLRGGLIT